jgi:UDP-N-acetyl-D-glucosamine dehydrogenase
MCPPAPSRRSWSTGAFRATASFDALDTADAVCICVPTPLRKSQDPDISFIVAAVDEIVPRLHPGMLVVLESTTYPGTTDELVLPRLEDYRPARRGGLLPRLLARARGPGEQAIHHAQYTPKVVGGVTPACTERALQLYRHAVETVVTVTNARTAEMVKLLENTFRAVNIGMVNELAQICDRLDVDVWDVIDAAKTKPFGFMPFYPGPGLGGHCIPIDPLYLSWKLKTLDYNARFIELASDVNASMPQYVLEKIVDALNSVSKSVKGSKILILGLAYKKDVSDVRESPALDIIGMLAPEGRAHHLQRPVCRRVGAARRDAQQLPARKRRAGLRYRRDHHQSLRVRLQAPARRGPAVFDTRGRAHSYLHLVKLRHQLRPATRPRRSNLAGLHRG